MAIGNCVKVRGDDDCCCTADTDSDTDAGYLPCRIELFLGLKAISDMGSVRGLSVVLVGMWLGFQGLT